jgi:putative transposase
LLVTPVGPLERTAQLIKGGFSFQAKREFEWKLEIWQRGFSDHRIRGHRDIANHLAYVQKNFEALHEAQRLHRGRRAGDGTLTTAPIPPRLKPDSTDMIGAAEAVPFQKTVPEIFADGANIRGEQSSL